MPKIFEFKCVNCGTIQEEWYGDTEKPDGEKTFWCKSCDEETQHTKVQFSRNPHRWYINDSPYGDKVRG